MKYRQGFVSNSSSSSFLIFGINIESIKEELCEYIANDELLNEQFHNEYGENEDITDWQDGELAEYISNIHPIKDSNIGEFYGYDNVYLGRSWDSIGDDETGREFKESIMNTIAEMIPDIDTDLFCTYEEVVEG